MAQMILVVRQTNDIDVKQLQSYLKDGWIVGCATPLNGYSNNSFNYFGEVQYILKK